MLLTTLTTIFMSVSVYAQVSEAEKPAAEPPQAVEEVNGFWSVMGYFGSKLTNELGERLNLVKTPETPLESVPTKVNLKIGRIEFTRTENRLKTVK